MIKLFSQTNIILVVCVLTYVNADCIWYGECGPSQNDGAYNCKYRGPPKPLEDASDLQDLFKTLCPHLYNGNDTLTCCDRKQIERLDSSISVPKSLMTRCPACLTNFKSFLCDMTCNPQQSEFLKITNEQPFNSTLQKVIEISYSITNVFTNNMYNSCK